MKLDERCQAIEPLLADVDGVLTDGQVVFDNQGIETKHFHIRDGMGIKLWQRAGHKFGLVTGRSSHIVKIRAAELGVDIVRQTAEDKLPAVQEIVRQLGLSLEQVCYIGDDLPDLPAVRSVGLGIAVADGCAELRAAAHWTSSLRGGEGAVRETIEMILKAQRRWDELVQKYVH
jgi:YrbI family 3-deoxy-D-manno-octulosonate 8-phosphate phosphatase